jgi:hypothetical protein
VQGKHAANKLLYLQTKVFLLCSLKPTGIGAATP